MGNRIKSPWALIYSASAHFCSPNTPFSSNSGTSWMTHCSGAGAESVLSALSLDGRQGPTGSDMSYWAWNPFHTLTPSYSKINLQGYQAGAFNLNKYGQSGYCVPITYLGAEVTKSINNFVLKKLIFYCPAGHPQRRRGSPNSTLAGSSQLSLKCCFRKNQAGLYLQSNRWTLPIERGK